jgi:hypothetical protein
MSLDAGTTIAGSVHGVLWDARVRAGAAVGRCRCGGDLYGRPVRFVGRRRWYDAECNQCLREVSSPDSRMPTTLAGVAA